MHDRYYYDDFDCEIQADELSSEDVESPVLFDDEFFYGKDLEQGELPF